MPVVGYLSFSHSGLLQNFQRFSVNPAIGGKNTMVVGEAPSGCKIKRFPIRVSDDTAGLQHNPIARCLIPDELAVIRTRGRQQPK